MVVLNLGDTAAYPVCTSGDTERDMGWCDITCVIRGGGEIDGRIAGISPLADTKSDHEH